MVLRKCEFCNYSTASKFNFEKHLQTKKHLHKMSGNSKNEQKNVEKCGKNVEKSSDLIPDITIMTEKSPQKSSDFVCVFCSKNFSRLDSLKRHISVCKLNFNIFFVHKDPQGSKIVEKSSDFQCHFCHNSYQTKRGLNKHVKSCLTREKELQNKLLQKELLLASKTGLDEEDDLEGHNGSLHESPWSMTFPLVFLAVPSVTIGFIGLPWDSKFASLLDPEEAEMIKEAFDLKDFLPLAIASVVVASVGITIAYKAYFTRTIDLPSLFAARFPTINQFLQNKWYLDDINEKIFVKGSRKLAKEVLEVDSKVVDGVVNLTGLITLGSGEGLKYFETGRAQFYALIVFGGVILLVAIFGFQSPQVT